MDSENFERDVAAAGRGPKFGGTKWLMMLSMH